MSTEHSDQNISDTHAGITAHHDARQPVVGSVDDAVRQAIGAVEAAGGEVAPEVVEYLRTHLAEGISDDEFTAVVAAAATQRGLLGGDV
ncbi:MAG: hypothetical protein INR66_00360 [Gordonia polyisoprenivorans]|nr:hypothetical protein [Gordonia polyisoprenivorans]